MGIQVCVCVCSLPSHLRDPFDFPRSWMLPLLRVHITHTELGYFAEALLPLANQLGQTGNPSDCHTLVAHSRS